MSRSQARAIARWRVRIEAEKHATEWPAPDLGITGLPRVSIIANGGEGYV